MTGAQDSRPATEWANIGRNMLLPIEEAVEPRGYIRCLNTNDLPWIPAFEFVAVHQWELDLTYTPAHRLQFRMEVFNAPNRANFGQPNPAVDQPAGGAIGTAQPGRQIQLALKYLF